MAGNIAEYVRWRGDISFEMSPFNNVDALIFAQLSYNKLEGLMSSDFDKSITLSQLVNHFKKAPDFEKRKNLGFMINPETVELLFLCAQSKRFGDVKVTAFRSIYSEENCEQFAAVTFTFGKNSVVAFRGTDDHLVGWKEDFNISYMNPVPAQADAVTYLTQAGLFFRKNSLYITGQSKGGNLSVYAGTKAPDKLKRRIKNIYNFDGPGFSLNFLKSKEYKKVQKRIVSIYPEFCIVGKFFKHDSNFTIIKSSENGIRQHDSMSLLCCGNDFVPGTEFTGESRFFENSFNDWVDNLTEEDKKHFSDALFDILFASGYKTNLEISQNIIKASAEMFKAFVTMDIRTKNDIKRIIGVLKEAIHEEIPIFNFLEIPK